MKTQWAQFINNIRGFCGARGYLEVWTNLLTEAGAFEASLDVLSVHWSDGNAQLHTSPEMAMKVLLSEDPRSIFQICKCFRDDPETGIHQREFTMLEMYKVGATYRELRAETKELFETLSGEKLNFEELTVEELVSRTTGLSLRELSSRENLLQRMSEQWPGMHLTNDDDWDDLFFKLMMEQVEPKLDPRKPTLVYDYPVRLCALGKIDEKRGVVERFEIYWKGMEICNGCTELTDYSEVLKRYETESEARKRAGKRPHPVPTSFLNALEKGLPACAGVAIGLDRLLRCLTS